MESTVRAVPTYLCSGGQGGAAAQACPERHLNPPTGWEGCTPGTRTVPPLARYQGSSVRRTGGDAGPAAAAVSLASSMGPPLRRTGSVTATARVDAESLVDELIATDMRLPVDGKEVFAWAYAEGLLPPSLHVLWSWRPTLSTRWGRLARTWATTGRVRRSAETGGVVGVDGAAHPRPSTRRRGRSADAGPSTLSSVTAACAGSHRQDQPGAAAKATPATMPPSRSIMRRVRLCSCLGRRWVFNSLHMLQLRRGGTRAIQHGLTPPRRSPAPGTGITGWSRRTDRTV